MQVMIKKVEPPNDSVSPSDTMVVMDFHTSTDIQELVRDFGDGDGLGLRTRSLDPNSKKRK